MIIKKLIIFNRIQFIATAINCIRRHIYKMSRIINIKNLIYIVVFSTPLYLIKLKIFTIPTNVLELLILLAFFFRLYEKKTNVKCQMSNVKCQKYFLPVFLILLGLFASTLINHNYHVGFGIIKGWFAMPLVIAFLIIKEIKNEKEIQNILKALYYSAFVVGLISLFYFFSGDITYDERLKAFYLSPNYLAMFLSPGLVSGIWFLVSGIKDKKYAKYPPATPERSDSGRGKILNTKYLHIICLIIIGTALYLTYSYAAWIAVILSSILVSLIKKEKLFKKTLVVSCLLLVVSLILISQVGNSKFQNLINLDTRSSLASRVMIWKSAAKILGDNLIFGIGPGNFQNKYLEYQKYFPLYLEWAVPQPHNLFLAFWLQGGMLGIIGFLLLIFYWLRDMINFVTQSFGRRIVSQNSAVSRYQDAKNSEYLAFAVLGIMFYILIHGLADTAYWKNDLSAIFWIVMALGIIIAKKNIANKDLQL